MPLTFVNGPIWTGTPHTPEWVQVDRGRITSIGSGRAPAGERFDLEGRCLLPGFQDAHVHPPIGGSAMMRCELHDVPPPNYPAVIRAYADAHADAPWIVGGGWPMSAFPDGIARREALDAVVADRPVMLYSAEGHAAWVNSRALAVSGIDRHTADPVDGRIEHDADGSPNGTLQEGAMALVEAHLPPDTVAEMTSAIELGQRHLLSLGITGWQDAWVRSVDHQAYRRLDAEGRLIASVVGALWWDRSRGVEQLPELIQASMEASPRYRPGAVKLMVDGVVENGTGAMCAPYVDTGDHGLCFLPRALLVEIVPQIMAAGLQPHFHAIGDCAVRSALDSIAAGDPADVVRTRPHIAHVHVVDPVDVARFATLGVVANAQSLWACSDDTMTELTMPRLGPERAQWQYPFRSLIDQGATLAAGSDWSVSTADPFAQMAVAVTRRRTDAGEPLLADQAITLDEALTAFTVGSAWVNHREHVSGTIEPGKVADLVVASDDPFSVADLAVIDVEMTMVEGTIVHTTDTSGAPGSSFAAGRSS